MDAIEVGAASGFGPSAANVIGLSLVVNTPKVSTLVKRFQQFSRKTAEGILEMGRAVNEARQLPESEFHRFCELIQMKSSNIKKLAVIGAKYEYLMSRADKLPSNWTTVYAVARLANEEIQTLIDQGVVNNRVEMSDLDTALGKKTKIARKPAHAVAAVQTQETQETQSAPPDWSFQVQLTPNPDPATRQVLKSLLDQLRAMKMQVLIATKLEDFLKTT
jgi:hypothetical protein